VGLLGCGVNLRIQKVKAKLTQENLDGLILSSPANISYLTEYTSRDSCFLISKKTNIYITDSRYTEEARKSLKGRASIRKLKGSLFKTAADASRELGLKRIGFEERFISFSEHKLLNERLNRKGRLIPTYGLVEDSREIKTAEELEKIKEAARITTDAFEFINDYISPGKKETEVAAELERFIRYRGARSSAFDIIVASGPNSSFPHHLTSQRRLKNNELVLIDMGVDYMGYKSDLTRVFFLGKINATVKRVYEIVRKAQDKAIEKIKPAVLINQIDAAARQYIIRRGYGGFFGHNLGHGIGLEVHEKPRISGKENSALKAGMVFTVEPGIYLPGKFGIRLEDMVFITNKGCEVISGALNK